MPLACSAQHDVRRCHYGSHEETSIGIDRPVHAAQLRPGRAGRAETVTITILESSDLHGSIASYDYAVDAPPPTQVWPGVASVVKAEREKDPDLLLLDCGDSIQANMISLFNGDVVHPMINAMNFVGYDVWELGNHEFNYDFDMLERAISFFEGDVLIANAYNADGTRWQKPYSIFEVKGSR